jgi:hypothetical protein
MDSLQVIRAENVQSEATGMQQIRILILNGHGFPFCFNGYGLLIS